MAFDALRYQSIETINSDENNSFGGAMQVIESQCYSVDGKNRGAEPDRDHPGNDRRAQEQTPIKLGGKSSRLKKQVGDRKDL